MVFRSILIAMEDKLRGNLFEIPQIINIATMIKTPVLLLKANTL